MSERETLLRDLEALAAARCERREPAHDFSHVLRVRESAVRLARAEGADLDVVEPATLLHELFNHPKSHPESHLSGEICAEHAARALSERGVPPARIEAIAYCIRVHPFSRGIAPATLEAKVLQDADRLDSIGAIGIARCFATCADMKRPFYAPDDPFCRERAPDDKAFGLDHFFRKLLKIPAGLHTAEARRLAGERVKLMEAFLSQLADELGEERGSNESYGR